MYIDKALQVSNEQAVTVAAASTDVIDFGQANPDLGMTDLCSMVITVDESAAAWEKRGYWMKVERFVRDFEWIPETAANLDDIIRHNAWDLLPELLADLSPRFDDINIKTMTRKPTEWRGTYARLMAAPPVPSPYQSTH